MFLKVKEILENTLGGLAMVYPDWKEVDHTHPEKTFHTMAQR